MIQPHPYIHSSYHSPEGSHSVPNDAGHNHFRFYSASSMVLCDDIELHHDLGVRATVHVKIYGRGFTPPCVNLSEIYNFLCNKSYLI